jgi:hypothetical protein
VVNRRLICTLTIAGCVLAPPVAGQTTGSLTVAGGSSTDTRGFRSNAVTVAPAVVIAAGLRSTVWLGGTATAFQSDAWSIGANAALSTREPVGRFAALAFSARGAATRTSYDVTLARADAVPALELSWGGLTGYGGARASIGSTTVPGQVGGGPFPIITPGSTVTRTSVAPVYGAQLRLAARDALSSLTLWGRDERAQIDRVSIADRTAGAVLRSGDVALSGMLGQRRADDERRDYSSASLTLALSPTVVFEVAGGSYASDRFTGAAAGRFLNAGLQFRFGAGAAHRSMPSPRGVPAAKAGFTRFVLRAPDAARVELMGDWNGWKPVAAQKSANGVWYADLRLAPGEYRYAFRVDGSEWRVPDGAPAVDDGFGAKSAYIAVRDANAAK